MSHPLVTGEYSLKNKSIQPFAMIGQRLYTGRVAVAQAALAYRRKLFEVTREYTEAKPIWSPLGGEPKLSGIPQLRSLFAEAEETATTLEAFVGRCEDSIAEVAQHRSRAGDRPVGAHMRCLC